MNSRTMGTARDISASPPTLASAGLALLLFAASGCKEPADVIVRGVVSVASGPMAARSPRESGGVVSTVLAFLESSALAYTHVGVSGHSAAICVRSPSGQLQLAEPAVQIDSIRTTDSQGVYGGIKVAGPAYDQRGNGLFVCASSPDGSFTQIATIPPEDLDEGGAITVDVNPTETIITKLLCGPGLGGDWYKTCTGSAQKVVRPLVEARVQPDAKNLGPSFLQLKKDTEFRQKMDQLLKDNGVRLPGGSDPLFDQGPSSLPAPTVPAPAMPPPSGGGPLSPCTPTFCQLACMAGGCSSVTACDVSSCTCC